jgi:hypothetical protein
MIPLFLNISQELFPQNFLAQTSFKLKIINLKTPWEA